MSNLKNWAAGIACALVAACATPSPAQSGTEFRPPAIPLVTTDPYLSIWSEADHLTDETTRHWTHRDQALVSLIRVDGKSYRLMGTDPGTVPALPQTGLQTTPTRSIYDFENANVHVTLTFMTAALPHDLDVLSRPLSYLTWDVHSVDGKTHAVSLYDSASSELAVNSPDQPVEWAREPMGALTAMRVGTAAQTLFSPPGDDTRINWGYAYLAAPTSQATAAIGADKTLLASFVNGGTLPATDDTRSPRMVSDDQPVLALAFDLGDVGAAPVSRHAMVAYDEVYSIKYFGQRLRPYWRRNGATPSDLLQSAERDYPSLVTRCADFDRELTADLTRVGGARYAQLVGLSYREALAGNGIAADAKGKPLMFTKENTSNGDIATMDVIFPMEPVWLLLSPTLAKASLVPLIAYGASPHWKFPNAPHDLGTYPVARGTDDGGEQMPVEESGNVLIDCDAIAREEGNADFVTPWWPKISQWAQYLEQFGQDPQDQLCTDDFMGHLAHNSNLSIKAIIALGAYADLCRMRGETKNATKYRALAKQFAQHWMVVSDDGDHARLAFDKPNTWGQMYNLVWDKILGLNIFPPSVAQREIAHYKTVLQPFGVPLDSRTHVTKTDWTMWSATLAGNQADFETLTSPMYDYFNGTTTHDAMADEFETDNIHSGGMHARPVIGGLFIKALADPALWKKWSSGDTMKVAGWAPLPVPPRVVEVIPTAQKGTPAIWRYTTTKPADGWQQPGFDDSSWQQGPAGFGNNGAHHTDWHTSDIWIRRTFTMPTGAHPNLQWLVFHDEDVQAYVNGVLGLNETGYNTSYEPFDIMPAARALLQPGATVTVAAHVLQTTGGQGIDIGLAEVIPAK